MYVAKLTPSRIRRSERFRWQHTWRPRLADLTPVRIWRSVCFRWQHRWLPRLEHAGAVAAKLILRGIEFVTGALFFAMVLVWLLPYCFFVFSPLLVRRLWSSTFR